MIARRFGSSRRSAQRRQAVELVERLEPRSLLTASPGLEFARPVGMAAATDPTAYFDVSSGELQIDPVARNISLVNFTYNTEVVNITGSTPGPFVFPAGTVQNAVSTATERKTLPAGNWSIVTTFPARLAGAPSLSNTPTLATSGPNTASTNGWFNKPWNFGVVVAPKSLTIADAERNFVSITTQDIGYGPGRDMFQYTEHGVVGSRYGRVVVYASPDLTTKANSVVGLAGDELSISRSTGSSFTTTSLATLPAGQTWANTVSGDFDGDSRTDVAAQTSAGTWLVTTNPSSGPSAPAAWGGVAAFQFPTVGDFNGDRKADIAVRDPADGSWQVLTSSGTGFTASQFGRWNPSLTWSNVLAGDFNNDGRDDLVGQRSDSAWVVAASTGTSFSSNVWAWFSAGQFGTVGDYNGDGRDDVAVRNPGNGSWRVLTSNGTIFTPLKVGAWDNTTTWTNVRGGDFNGDGRADIVGQRADGAWVVSLSDGKTFATSAWTYLAIGQFATVGDFNADGLDDVAVRNPTNGAWRVLASNGRSFTPLKFGDWPTAKAWSRAFAARS
ncbi:MAG: FG-GAP repeat domain-containing protein [Planctomycetaceae bacterium]